MTKKHVVLFIIILTSKIVIAQSPLTIGARHAGLAYASPAWKDDWSLWNNPAGLSGHNTLTVATNAEQRSALPGADRKAIVVNAPLWTGGIAAGVYRFGGESYNESLLSFAFGHKLGITSLGLRLDVIQFSTGGERFRLAGVTFGGIADIHERLSVGAWASNINQPRLPGGQHLPVRMAAGPLFRPSPVVLVAVSVEKDLAYDVSFRAGMEYQLYKRFFVRTGFRMFPEAAHFGCGFHSARIKADYAVHYGKANHYAHQAALALVVWKRKQVAR